MALLVIEGPRSDIEMSWLAQEAPELNYQKASSLGQGLVMASTLVPEQVTYGQLATYPRRFAVGAAEIWSKFPEFRRHFSVEISRPAVGGERRLRKQLYETLPGDRILSKNIRVSFGKMTTTGDHEDEEFEEMPIPVSLEHEYPHLYGVDHLKSYDISKYAIFFIRRIAFGDDVVFGDGLIHLNVRQLLENTNIEYLVKNVSQWEPGPASFYAHLFIPDGCSSVFLIPKEPFNYHFSYRTVARILASAAITEGADGNIVSYLSIDKNGYNRFDVDPPFEWRSYTPRDAYFGRTVYPKSKEFSEILHLIISSSRKKFDEASEDYRILALDTVDDSRATRVGAMSFAHMWMGIEKLLSFGAETSFRLSTSLCALFPADQRVEKFKQLKDLYDLRSKILHGYGYKQSANLPRETEFLGALFRRCFVLALSFSKGSDLGAALQRHVLLGRAEPMIAGDST